jgi:UDP-N-acetylmuramoylalanine--D-glutamate ligase
VELQTAQPAEVARLQGRLALVVGLGKSGVSAARLLSAAGARVRACDEKPAAALEGVLAGLPQLEQGFFGGLTAAAFAGVELVVLSPGVPLSHPLLQDAFARGVEVIGEVELAARLLPETEPLLGITGTNGKSTTTALTAHLLSSAGLRVFAGGNLGTPLSERVLAGGALDASVCELSSFQLETIDRLRCRSAVVLNVTPDHLDRYPSLDAYAAAKARIFARQGPGDLCVLSWADARVREMRPGAGAETIFFDPRLPGAQGAPPAAGLFGRRTGPRSLEAGGHAYTLTAPTLRGDHNVENALAALALVRPFALTREQLQRGLDTYPGLPHRLEPVATLGGVEWLNDSKATNVDSVEKSLSAFPAEPGSAGRVLLLMGGKGKGAPYAPLRPLFAGRIRALLTLGADGPRIHAELGDLCESRQCGDLAAAMDEARALARPGDFVLLSPACASYDQFRHFEDRGDQFKARVAAFARSPAATLQGGAA